MNPQELEDRLILFAVLIIKISEKLARTFSGKHLANQLLRSGTSPALNYGEARGAESRKDFVHKIRISLKELRETFVCLKIIKQANIIPQDQELHKSLNENDELIRIFVSITKTTDQKIKSQN